MNWAGTRWKGDDTGAVERLAKETVRSRYAEAAVNLDRADREAICKWARQSEAEARIRAMISLARSELGRLYNLDGGLGEL